MLEPVRLVPGHGEIGTLADVTLIENYINTLLQMAEQNWHEGGKAPQLCSLLHSPKAGIILTHSS